VTYNQSPKKKEPITEGEPEVPVQTEIAGPAIPPPNEDSKESMPPSVAAPSKDENSKVCPKFCLLKFVQRVLFKKIINVFSTTGWLVL